MEFNNQNPNQFLMVSKEDLREELLKLLEEINQKPIPKIWISSSEAMNLLQLKSKTSLQKIRDLGRIKTAKPLGNKIILYNYQSILDFIESKSQKPF